MRSMFLALLVLTACGGDKSDDTSDTPGVDADTDTDTDADTDADTDTDTDTDTDLCTANIVSVDPAPNFQLAPIDQVVNVRFDAAIAATDPWFIEIDGVAGTSSLDTDMRGVTFVPTADLAQDTTYTVLVEVCQDSSQASFRTLPPPIDGSDVESTTYAVDFDNVDITEPPNSGLLDAFLPIDYILVQVASVDLVDESIVALGAVAANDANGDPQVDCGAAIDGVDVDFSVNPFFTMGPTVLFIDAGADVLPIREFTLLGRFAPDGSEIQDVRVSGLVDMTAEPSGFRCSQVAALTQGTCVACSVGAVTDECLVLDAVAPYGSADPRFDIDATCFPTTP